MREFGNLKGEVLFLNKVLFNFEIERGELIHYNIVCREHLPYEFRLCKSESKAIMFFLDDRVVPETRIGLSEDLKRAGIPYFDMDMIIQRSNGFSLEDYYWVRFKEGIQTWEDLIYQHFGRAPENKNDYERLVNKPKEYGQ